MAISPIKQLTTGQRLMGGVVLFEPHDAAKVIKIGPVGAVTLTPTLTEVESRSDESGSSQLIGSWVTQTDGVLQIADIQMWTDALYDAMFLAERTYRTQTAVPSTVLVVEEVAAGDVIQLPGIKPSITTITDGAAENSVAYTEDATGFGDGNYIYQKSRALLEFIKVPADATANATVTYTLPEITAADKIVEREIMRTSGIRGKLSVLGVVAEGRPGVPVDYIFPDVEFRPNGDITLKGVDALNVGSLTGKVYNQGGLGYGFVRPVYG